MSNRTIQVGLVGYGLAGSVFHAPLIRACAHMNLAAVLTSRAVPNAVHSLDELIDKSELVVVASPNTSHFPIARQALEAGRDVVIDKPFTVTVEQADELIRAAATRQLVLSAFHNRRWDSDFLTVRTILPRLGEIFLFEANWDRFRPQIKLGWRESPEPGGGLLNDLGPHLIDQALQLFGMPDHVAADIFAQRNDALVDDYFDVTLHYANRRVCLRSSTLVAAPRPRFAIHGTAGSFIKHGLDPQETQLKAGFSPNEPTFGLDQSHGDIVFPDGRIEAVPTERGKYEAYYEGIAMAILGRTPVPVSAQDARDVLVVIDLARRASVAGRRVPMPGANQKEE